MADTRAAWVNSSAGSPSRHKQHILLTVVVEGDLKKIVRFVITRECISLFLR